MAFLNQSVKCVSTVEDIIFKFENRSFRVILLPKTFRVLGGRGIVTCGGSFGTNVQVRKVGDSAKDKV